MRSAINTMHQATLLQISRLPSPPSAEPVIQLLRICTAFSTDFEGFGVGSTAGHEKLVQELTRLANKFRLDILATVPIFIPWTDEQIKKDPLKKNYREPKAISETEGDVSVDSAEPTRMVQNLDNMRRQIIALVLSFSAPFLSLTFGSGPQLDNARALRKFALLCPLKDHPHVPRTLVRSRRRIPRSGQRPSLRSRQRNRQTTFWSILKFWIECSRSVRPYRSTSVSTRFSPSRRQGMRYEGTREPLHRISEEPSMATQSRIRPVHSKQSLSLRDRIETRCDVHQNATILQLSLLSYGECQSLRCFGGDELTEQDGGSSSYAAARRVCAGDPDDGESGSVFSSESQFDQISRIVTSSSQRFD